MRLLALVLLATGCSDYRSNPLQYVEPSLVPYVKRFEAEFGMKSNVSLYIVDLKKESPLYAGVCKTVGTPNSLFNFIKIDAKIWQTHNEASREQLIYHELGHCVLGLEHDAGIISFGIYQQMPRSIMYPSMFGYISYYPDNRQYYVDELKAKAGL